MVFTLLLSLVFFQLLFPHRVDLLVVEIGENKVEHITVPVDGVPFDVCFDVLSCVSKVVLYTMLRDLPQGVLPNHHSYP